MSSIQTIEELCHICQAQSFIIKAQAEALAQVGAAVMEEERADVGRALTALIGHDEVPDDVPAKANKISEDEGCPWKGTALADYK